jgi:exopolysaccharide production protein ExoZ
MEPTIVQSQRQIDRPPFDHYAIRMAGESKAILHNVQALRAFAALAVVYYHFTAALRLSPIDGAFGVDVFFVISGFVIAWIGQGSSGRFLAKRLIRIAPFYWIATLLYFVLVRSVPGLATASQASGVHLACSLAFLPCGDVWSTAPLLSRGWTLNYEIYFYALFALALAANRKWAPLLSCALIFVIAAALHFSGIHARAARFYSSGITIEFIYGVAIYYLAKSAPRWAGERSALLALILLGLLSLIVFGAWRTPWRWLAAGVPAFALVLGAVLAETRFSLRIRSRAIALLGDSSYILYLIHPFFFLGLQNRSDHRFLATPIWERWLVGIALAIAASIVSIMLHLWFERPIIVFLRRRLQDSRAIGAGTAHRTS